jgi:hypothetical protein
MNNVFPFRENAELFFNSSQVLEVNGLARIGLALAKEATECGIKNRIQRKQGF